MAKSMKCSDVGVACDFEATAPTPAEAERIYKGLSDKAEIGMALQETFWAQRFAMLVDKFGTPWMINCEKKM